MPRGLQIWAAVLVLTIGAIVAVLAFWVLALNYAPPVSAIMFTGAFAILLALLLGKLTVWLAKE